MSKVLILVDDKNKYFWYNVSKGEDIEVEEVYKWRFQLSFLNRVKKRNRKLSYIYFGIFNKWKNRLKYYDKVIFLDSSYTRQADYLIKQCKKRGTEVFFFFWNKMNLDYDAAQNQMKGISREVKLYTYSRFDSELHHVPFNTTMYAPSNVLGKDQGYKQDVFFGGRLLDERISELDRIIGVLKDNHITYGVDVCVDVKQKESKIKPKNFVLKDKVLDYEEYLKEINASKAILNIDKYEGMGCSLRAMEAIFYHKKYVTNNQDVKKELFYRKENVFILGQDCIENLKEFLNNPYVEIDQDILDYYNIKEWVKRFK